METKTFSTNSFLYKFLAWPFDTLPYRKRPQDICDLRRAVIGQVFLILTGIGVAFAYVFLTASAALYLASPYFEFLSAYSSQTEVVKWGLALLIITTGVAGVFGLVFVLCYSGAKYTEWSRNRRYAREKSGLKPLLHPVTNPIKELYTTWKEKLCYRVSFE